LTSVSGLLIADCTLTVVQQSNVTVCHKVTHTSFGS